MKVEKGEFNINTDKTVLDIPFIHQYLTQSYWSEGIPMKTIEKAISGSVCFGLYRQQKQIGFARIITDSATFAYLADVFIDENYRGKGLSKWLMEVIMSHESVHGLRRFMLATRDAHGLYKQYGFAELTHPERWMQIHKPDIYKSGT